MKIKYSKEDSFLRALSSNDALFHYTKKTIALEKILYEDNFRLSSLKTTNDPYEYKDKMIGASGWGWDENIRKKGNLTSKILDRLIENISFISCCSNKMENGKLTWHGCLKSRMWSQYGESHAGVCLVFSKDKLLNLVRENLQNEYKVYDGSVDYREYVNEDSGHDLININNNSFDKSDPYEVAIEHINKWHSELFFRKQLDYKDEDEYRIVALRKKIPKSLFETPNFKTSKCLIGILLGDRFPEVYIPSIGNISKKWNYTYRLLHWESGEYTLRTGRKY